MMSRHRAHHPYTFTEHRRTPPFCRSRPPAGEPGAFERLWLPRRKPRVCPPSGSQTAPPTAPRRAPGYIATPPSRTRAPDAPVAAGEGRCDGIGGGRVVKRGRVVEITCLDCRRREKKIWGLMRMRCIVSLPLLPYPVIRTGYWADWTPNVIHSHAVEPHHL
jgi:hypothetical protein